MFVPGAMLGFAGVSAMEVNVAEGPLPVLPSPPHEVRNAASNPINHMLINILFMSVSLSVELQPICFRFLSVS